MQDFTSLSDFKSFSQKTDLLFDFIICHGTWSWISPIHQRSILEIVAKFLKQKGIFYLHYMCYPGSTPLLPIQKLLNLVDHHVNESSNKSIEIGKNLFNDFNIDILADKSMTKDELLSVLGKFYTPQKQEEFGVLCIMVELS